MAHGWISVRVVVWSIMCSFTANVRSSPCAEVHAPSAVVPIGSPVTASCYIKEDCPLTKGQDFHVEWPYQANLNYSDVANQNESIKEIIIHKFTDRIAMLHCAICRHEDCNVVAGVEIKAASPPPAPQNLTCLLNLTAPCSLLCTWNPGQETSSIPTNYTLHTEFGTQRFDYVLAPRKHFYRVPRNGFALFYTVHVHVEAVNALGRATSEHWEMDPMETVKLDAPEIQNVWTGKYGCLRHMWSLSEPQRWIVKRMFMEIRLTTMDGKVSDRKQVTFSKNGKSGKPVDVCDLLHGMNYQSEMRVRYLSSPWSEWSHPTVATTLIKAPAGHLVTWLKLLGQSANRRHRAELFWKPSLQFRANSMNVSYIVSLVRPLSQRNTVCNTSQQHCSFQIPVDVRKIHLTAVNTAGKSNPTEVAVYKRTERGPVPYLRVYPESEESVLTEWSSPVASAVSFYILEWKALHEASTISFEIVDKNQSSLVVAGLEPYQPYNISIYPKYNNGIGQPCTVMAYTRQKAPSKSPEPQFGEIRPSYVELYWDEIPLQQRNGIITSYRVFYWDDKNSVGDLEGTEQRVILKDLQPSSIYNIILMTSTTGGSINGTTVTVKTPSIDAFEIVLIVIPACVGLTLLFLGVFTCFSNNRCLKKCLWPMIPDPANSSIKKWTMANSQQDIPSFKEVKDPVLVYLSHFSLLSLSEKELWKGSPSTSEYLHCGKWSYDGKSVNDDHSDSSRDSGIYNSGSQSESVPYATVVFANSYRTQPAAPPAYLRSESTQPLLSEEEPCSPRPYEKMSTQAELSEADHFSTFQEDLGNKEERVSLWEDFPMLKSLEVKSINDQA
ncbi:granulocyte colony-stimulating factor receptor isoform X2 [Colossoma macropomum]|uniref:granulocyte colony-stimulating factor receptor isoform X2 n=1 Tax=Colossoma macropomum TaxID=42526 RepID=UPI0018645909|nr:granulocyte colony-stimulating factor receptor isoform X2 [Colossoma macropomum]